MSKKAFHSILIIFVSRDQFTVLDSSVLRALLSVFYVFFFRNFISELMPVKPVFFGNNFSLKSFNHTQDIYILKNILIFSYKITE